MRGEKHVQVVTSGNKAQITLLACENAAGYSLPPFVVYKRKRLTLELSKSEVQGTTYGLSSSGWMDRELFTYWFGKHFLLYALSVRLLLLLVDSHSSHYNPQNIKFAIEQGVIVFCLPPITTHTCQLLDVTVFHRLKSCGDQDVICMIMSKHPGKILTKYQFWRGQWCRV